MRVQRARWLSSRHPDAGCMIGISYEGPGPPGATHEAIKFLFVGTVLTSGEDFLLGRPRFRPRLNLSGIPKNRTGTLHALPLHTTDRTLNPELIEVVLLSP